MDRCTPILPDLPQFTKSDLKEIVLIGKGAYGKVFRCRYKGEENVWKVSEERKPSEHTQR
jgi:predicted Ser/Thr protein kinase